MLLGNNKEMLIHIVWLFGVALTIIEGNSPSRQVRGIYDDGCGATDLRAGKIDDDDREIEFTWKGKDGTRYRVQCYMSENLFDTSKRFTCELGEEYKLKKQKEKWFYALSDTEYHCAVRDFITYKISNIVVVRTPRNHDNDELKIPVMANVGVIVGSIFGVLVGIAIIVSLTVLLCRRRTTPRFMGTILRTPSRRQHRAYENNTTTSISPTAGVQQPPPYPSEEQHYPHSGQFQPVAPQSAQQQPLVGYPPSAQLVQPPPYPTAFVPQQQVYPFQPQPWVQPPLYTPEDVNHQPVASAPEPERPGFPPN